MRPTLIAALVLAPGLAFAAGGGDDKPPKQTKTTTECAAGTAWDDKTKTCVSLQESRLDDDTLYGAARELAYAGRHLDAITALRAMSNPEEDRVLTYLGFAYRKSGDLDRGMAYYRDALAKNPDNLLARSYMGQALVEMGEITLARAELTEIRRRGGRQSWAEISLRTAIESGQGFSY
jgi:tetratricopeptide (TPR) repeat protein